MCVSFLDIVASKRNNVIDMIIINIFEYIGISDTNN